MNEPWGSTPTPESLAHRVRDRHAHGERLAGLIAVPYDGGIRLLAFMDNGGELVVESEFISYESAGYLAVSTYVPAAAWYEREIHDLFGVRPIGSNHVDPLVLDVGPMGAPPRPGTGVVRERLKGRARPLPAHVSGEGVFTFSYGPVRSGVFETVEYLVETPGEDIPHLRTRVLHKHRGVEARFEGLGPGDGVLLAERIEGVASVAHAIAFVCAVEGLDGADVPFAAQWVRMIHAELERIANHLESMVRHVEAAGQAVAYARLSRHKESLQRLRARLCGSRFGRNVVVPGGVSGPLQMSPGEIFAELDQLQNSLDADITLLMATPSFIDRLRGTGTIRHDLARDFGALGPVGRASGVGDDVRFVRSYGAYGEIGHPVIARHSDGDALARQWVRIEEVRSSFHLVRQAVDRLRADASPRWSCAVDPRLSGECVGWAEAPQGELLYVAVIEEGHLVRVKPRSASFHNLGLFHAAFPKDILTDFAFIEASFGVSIAGVAG